MPTKPDPAAELRDLLPERSLIDSLFTLPLLRDLPYRGLLQAGLKLAVLFLLFLGLNWVLRKLITRTGERIALQRGTHHSQVARVRTLTTIGKSATFYVLLFFFAVGALGLMGINVMGLIGTAGVAGLAIGFGAQKLVKDIISGFFLLLEDQFAVGEFVTAGGTAIAGGGVTGTVEEIGIRATRLRDDDGRLYILSNGDITQVCNYSRGAVVHAFEIGIAAAADVNAAVKVLDDALKAASESLELTEPAQVAGVSAADAAKTTLRVTFHSPVLAGAKRPGDLTLSLRAAARTALLDAGIALA